MVLDILFLLILATLAVALVLGKGIKISINITHRTEHPPVKQEAVAPAEVDPELEVFLNGGDIEQWQKEKKAKK